MDGILSVFSFRGRARRTYYGLFFLITVGVYFGLSMVFSLWMVKADYGNFIEKMKEQDPKSVVGIEYFRSVPDSVVYTLVAISVIVLILLYIAWIAISVRRLHDMNATGWLVIIFIVIALVPYLGYILDSLVLTFWPGKKGPNAYGPDPRVPVAVADIFDRTAPSPPLR